VEEDMARVKVTWLGTGDPLEAKVLDFGPYKLPRGVPVEIGDDLIIADSLSQNKHFKVERDPQ
jgi:hypothetical protein